MCSTVATKECRFENSKKMFRKTKGLLAGPVMIVVQSKLYKGFTNPSRPLEAVLPRKKPQ